MAAPSGSVVRPVGIRITWLPLLAGLAIVYAVFQAIAHGLASDRGQAGLLVAVMVIAALVAVEGVLFRQSPAMALRSLGFGRPALTGLAVALGVSVLLIAVIPIYAIMRGASVLPYAGWVWLLPGLFAQGGLAEEALFRGYLLGRVRRERSFWPAAGLAALPFVVVHLPLFAIFSWPVALASVLLALILSFPLAYLFELGGSTIWPPALLHFTVQGALKVLDLGGDALLPLIWIGASVAIPYLVFLFCPSTIGRSGA
jgi:membrane protease YdiL (CAAX protease family)